MKSIHLMLMLVVSLSIACAPDKPKFDNPVDPDGVNYQIPGTPVLSYRGGEAVSDSLYTLTWTKTDRAQDYILEESATSDFEFGNTSIKTVAETSTQMKHTVLKQPVKYLYRVKGRNDHYNGQWSDIVSVTVSPRTFTLAGTVTGASEVSVTLSGDTSSGSTIVSTDGGAYSFTVIEGGSYMVTPSKIGYTFSPTGKIFTIITSNQTLNFTATRITCTISGTVSGADGVMISLSGDTSSSRTVNNGGSYSFTVAYGGSYTVTPSKIGYTFTPSSKVFSNLAANGTQNFVGMKQSFVLSGIVSGVDGVVVTLSGDATGSQTVNNNGSYSFTVGYGGNYTIIPSKTGFTFTPANKTYSGIISNQTQNFTAIKRIQQFTLTMAVNQSGLGTTNPTVGAHIYDENTVVTVTATPASGYQFVNWTGNVVNKSSATTTLLISADRTVTANFEMIPVQTTDITMVSIPGGSFSMGSAGPLTNAYPVHTVTLSAFEMSVYEITQGQYKTVMGTNPSYFSGDDILPVEQVSWWDAIKYCNALSEKAGLDKCYNESTGACDFTKKGFRLPTEAEWEYACRAGTTTEYYESDIDRAGWYDQNSGGITHPVGQKTPNAWGLYDMHGNVWEWCNDWYDRSYYASSPYVDPTGPSTGSYRVNRGGAWISPYYYCESDERSADTPDNSWDARGFRVVRRLSP